MYLDLPVFVRALQDGGAGRLRGPSVPAPGFVTLRESMDGCACVAL